jgi:muramoyltetrapeptide carboxypeptidase LdcA involved in peptidoglycan recycling
MIPSKLKKGDLIRVIAPSRSMGIISDSNKEIANERFNDLGLNLSFGKNVDEYDSDSNSSSIESRINDLHEAFADKNVKMIVTVIGGFNSNQLLDGIDWKLIKENPKIFCGYSDITILLTAIYVKTGMVTYYGPHYSSFGEDKGFDYSLENFKKCLFENVSFEVPPSKKWSNDTWYKDQENRKFVNNSGCVSINPGRAEGTIIGGNLNTLGLLHGTEYFPSLKNSILFIEDDSETRYEVFDRDLESLLQQPEANLIRGIVIGRFENASKISVKSITKIIKSKKKLDLIPVIYGADFGHTEPRFTFPIGGNARIISSGSGSKIEILES